jgi:bifunctional DNase/RNase
MVWMWIAKLEALPIALGLSGMATPRPLTIHFLASILKATGVQLEEVRIEALKDNIYYAVAKVRNGDLVSEIDVRPSDALGLALLMERPIFVAEDILEKAGTVIPEGKTAEVFFGEQWLEREGITLPEGKTIQIKQDKEQSQARMLKTVEEMINPAKTPPTEEEREQSRQRYLAYLLGEDA